MNNVHVFIRVSIMINSLKLVKSLKGEQLKTMLFVCLFVYGLEAPVPVLGLRGEDQTQVILPVTSTCYARVGKVSRNFL